MSKKWKIFFAILYYLLTFSLGIIIAVALPVVNREIITYEYLDKYITEGDYVKAVDLLGGIYNKESVLEDEEKKLYIFETNSLLVLKETDGDVETTKTVINGSYVCIVKGLNRVDFEVEKDNQSKVLLNGTEKIEILQSDLNNDGELDAISTLIDNNYICFSIDYELHKNTNSIEIIGASGQTVLKVEGLSLDFSSNFFNETKNFVLTYNAYYEDKVFSEEENTNLENMYNEINQNNPNYQKSGTYSLEEISKKANQESIIFVLLYFLWIYILGDCLVGKRYIFRFFKFIYLKIKNKIKKEEKTEQLAIGNNFYCTITFEATIYEGFKDDIIISYESLTNKENNFKCVLTSGADYLKKERVRGGSYKLANVECPGNTLIGIPEALDVKGYSKNIKFEIKKES